MSKRQRSSSAASPAFVPGGAQLSHPSCPGFVRMGPISYVRHLSTERSPEVRLDWLEDRSRSLLASGGRMVTIRRSAPVDVAAVAARSGLSLPGGSIPEG